MKSDTELVFVGGWGYEADALRPLSDRIGKRYRTTLLSPTEVYLPEAGPGMNAFAAGLVRALESLSTPPLLAGWSLGGLIALAAAQQQPGRIARLALIASTPRFVPLSGEPPAGTSAAEIRALRAAFRRHPETTIAAFRARAASPATPAGTWNTPAKEMLLQGLDALAESDLRDIVRSLPVPLELLHGDADAIIPFSASVWMRDHAPNATLHRVAHAGHDLPLSDPDQVAEFLFQAARGRPSRKQLRRLNAAPGPDRSIINLHERTPSKVDASPSEAAHRAAVGARFGRAAETYEGWAEVQHAAAEGVLDRLPTHVHPRRILDAGCGTGLLTRRLWQRFPAATVVGVDISDAMLRVARRESGEKVVQWIAADLMDWSPETPFDLIASSSALHWVHPLSNLAARLPAWLRPGGWLVAAVMVHGTLQELHDLRATVAPHNPPAFRLPTTDELQAALETNGFILQSLETLPFIIRAPSAAELLTHLREQGLTGGGLSRGKRLLNRTELTRLLRLYEERHSAPGGGVHASYRVAFVQARSTEALA